MSDAYIVASLTYATKQIDRHGTVLVILLGTIGNMLNILILNDRTLYENPCMTYFWWSSISSIIFIWSGLFTRVLGGYQILWPNQNRPFCKIRLFIVMVCWSIATWAFVGATFDRYLCSSSSTAYRLKSSVRTARRILIGILLISIAIFAEVFYCYEANVPNVPVACSTQSPACQLYNDGMNILFDIAIPSGFMTVFGVLTILNIRKRMVYPMSRATVAPSINRVNIQPRLKKIDRNLRKILFIQVLALLLLNLPFGIDRFYANVTSNFPKSPLQIVIENLAYSIIVLLHFIPYSISFYINILSGSIFRAVIKRKVQYGLRRIHLLQQ